MSEYIFYFTHIDIVSLLVSLSRFIYDGGYARRVIGRLIKKSQLRILPTVSILTVDFENSMNRFFGKRNIHEQERMPADGRESSKEKAFLYVRKIIRKLFPPVVLKYVPYNTRVRRAFLARRASG